MSAPAEHAELLERLRGSALEGISIGEPVGRGRRSRVYRCRWRDRDCALKVHEPLAAERHRRLTGQGIAAFEYARNLEYYRAPGLARYVAEPLGFASSDSVEALAQELLEGELYYDYFRRRGGAVPASLGQDLERMVAAAHAAQLYDMDLHAMNVMVIEQGGAPLPKLFDFNLIPFTVRPQNVIVGWLLKSGLMKPESRDLRRLKHFHDFRPIERRLARRARES